METKSLLLRYLLCATIIFFVNLFDSKVNAQNCLNPVGEDSFDLSPHENNPSEASAKIADFKDKIKLNNGTDINILAAEINTAALCVLKAEAVAQQTALIAEGTSCVNYITAVNIILGMNPSTKTLELYYQPMVLCFNQTVSVGTGTDQCIFGEYTTVYSAKYYAYTSDSFSVLSVPDQSMVIEAIKTYTSSIKITHYPGDSDNTYQVPNSGEDAAGDVSSVIFSFSEINKVILDNNTDKIRIWNEIMVVKSPTDNIPRNKHSLILSGKNSNGVDTKQKDLKVKESYMSAEFMGTEKLKSFVSAYANLAHLCPPNCNTLWFKRTCSQ